MSYGKVEYDDNLDAFKCEICGKWFHSLSHHVHFIHGITINEYRKRFGLAKSTPLISYFERQKHREREIKKGTFRRLKSRPSFKKGDNTIQKYKRSAETLIYLKERFYKIAKNKKIDNKN